MSRPGFILPVIALIILTAAAPGSGVRAVRVGLVDQGSPGRDTRLPLEGTPAQQAFFVELFAYIAAREGWDVEYVPGALSDGLGRLRAGEIDLLGPLSSSRESFPELDFTREAMISTWAEIYTPASAPVVLSFARLVSALMSL